MIITNRRNLPQAFVEMCRSDYKTAENEWRVTSLLKGVREAILERRHSAEIERDVSDMIWLLFGTAVHSVLERAPEGEQEFHEERLRVPIGNYILSGKFDSYDAGKQLITDYKTCSVWKVIKGDYEDWRRQCLIYAWMLRKIGFNCTQAEIIAIMKDHSKAKAKFDKDYPQYPVQVIHFSFREKDFERIEAWLVGRFSEIERLEGIPDDALPICTAEERYNSGTKYAVMQKGKKRAVRVLNDAQEAQALIAHGIGTHVEIRAGEDKKCAEYCAACEFCNYYKERVRKNVQTA